MDRPILFSAPMVRALVEGRKTQTRRVLKPQPIARPTHFVKVGTKVSDGRAVWEAHDQRGPISGAFPSKTKGCVESQAFTIAPGDRLWVREAWRTFVSLDKVAPVDLLTPERGAGIAFEAGGGVSIGRPPGREVHSDYALEPREDRAAFGRLRAGMHLPRWASRITLVVTEVRVQRLQEISASDAEAEGIRQTKSGAWSAVEGYAPLAGTSAVGGYYCLWNALHGADAWERNPFVAAITFRTILANIDAPEAMER